MAVEPKPTPPNSKSNSTTPSPYITAPSSPKDTNSNDPPPTYFNLGDSCSSAVPFNWEEKPGKPKSFDISSSTSVDFDDTFAFDFSGIDHSESFSLSAEELFDDGKIKPLKPPPRLQRLESELIGNDGGGDSASQRSLGVSGWSSSSSLSSGVSHSKRMITRKSAWSRRSCDFDPFEAAFENTRKETRGDEKLSGEKDLGTGRYCCSRGRGRTVSFSKLREFLSFRRRVIVDGDGKDSKGSSFRSTGSSTSASSASYSGSIHELYGGVIPYKQRVLGCLGFNRTVHGLVKMI